ncbi:MAG: acyl-CoA dehydrogenase C-terminal domain-containing protein [Gammaproteobacteria bacterium]|nr:acyl-CoA dehydrogenase C-terminal domain-containing protein [Gammaproteobacteria bacterium]
MPKFTPSLDDMQFIMHDFLKITDHYQAMGFEDASDPELVNAILEESGKFASEVLSPLNHPGDQTGCKWNDGVVTTPNGFKEAYKQYCDAGWAALASSTEYGGQGLPYSLGLITSEMNVSANTSWNMYPGLTHGAIHALAHHGSGELKQQYLPNLINGIWTGTMCLTEAHCGSDLGMLRSKAEPQDDGSYNITGTKIFISAGEHDMAENIIHLVLARIPGSPQGSAGISLFLVPKILDVATANGATDNQVTCASIEHKMGIKASATAVLNFDDSKGYLIGEINKGLACMFTMMNSARLGTGLQGYGIAELSRQASLEYAKERIQMRSLSGVKAPDKEADPIIVHPDVKRMLLTQKALVEGCRALAYYTATLVDKVEYGHDPDGSADKILGLLTPICKAFMSEAGFECANHAVQVYGGHGYIVESEVEQMVRDARITMIYEGTNGIQSLDLLGRKVLRDRGEALGLWVKEIKTGCATVDASLKQQADEVSALCDEWLQLTGAVGAKVQGNMDEIGAAAFDFLMYSGYVTMAHLWLQQANASLNSSKDESFNEAKRQTMAFYFARILPRVKTHKALILSGADNLECNDFEI